MQWGRLLDFRLDDRPCDSDSSPYLLSYFSRLHCCVAFGNASTHSCFASDALRVGKLNKGPGGAQPLMREGFNRRKGLKQILEECGLWDQEYCARYPTGHGRPGYRPEGQCCARKILATERGFCEQKGRLQEEIEARGHKVIFYLSSTASSIRLSHTGAKLSGMVRDT